MAKQFAHIDEVHQNFIQEQPIFFSGTAAPEGRVNISPKGMDSLRVVGPNRILWLNYTGSGNETAGHLRLSDRMTLMWCSFGKRPLILRAYGTAKTLHPRDDGWGEALSLFDEPYTARQIYDMHVEMVQTSCGYAVPQMELTAERDLLLPAMTAKSGTVEDFWAERNTTTIDGQPTGIFGDDI